MKNTLKKLSELVSKLNLDPVLVDIGCSGDRHKIWDDIAPVSTLIGFDPDKRELNAHLETGYKNNIIIDRVVCDDDSLDEVDFVFTSNPYCSSLLQPDLDELKNYLFYDYFVPVSNEKVQATSLNRVIKERKLTSLDWIKIDSQGMDLKIINSLDEKYLSKVVALDVEPGFIPAYKGEDLFPSVHEFLVSKGFWLADLRSQKYPRVNAGSLREINSLLNIRDENGIEPFLTSSPTAAEARYLRTISSAAKCGEEQLLLLFIFSILCGHNGFAFDVKIEHEKKYEKNLNNEYISDFILNTLREQSFMPLWKYKFVKNIIKRFPSIKRYL
jgi:FkbM family methyltransferase